RSARPRSDVPAQVHDLFPDRRLGRRHDDDHRSAARRAAARHRRRRRQVLRSQARRLHRLHGDDRDPPLAAAGTFRASRGAVSAPSDAAATAAAATTARAASPAALALARAARWRWWEIALFAALPLSWLLLPSQSLLLNEIAIVALFAVSLDLILGY